MYRSYSIIIPIRVEHSIFEMYFQNLKFCLKALDSVDSINLKKEVIVSDYGSNTEYSKKIKELVCSHGYKYIFSDASEWSRSRAMNVAILCSNGDRVFFIDSDAILPTDYVKKHIYASKVENYTSNAVWNSKIRDIKKKTSDYIKLKKLPGDFRRAKSSPKGKYGGWSHFSVDRSWLISNGGYNEQYIGYGSEDNEILFRMKVTGLERVILDNCNPIHLWHPGYRKLMRDIGKGDWYENNCKRNAERYSKYKSLVGSIDKNTVKKNKDKKIIKNRWSNRKKLEKDINRNKNGIILGRKKKFKRELISEYWKKIKNIVRKAIK